MCRECGCGPPHHAPEHGHGRRTLTKTEKIEKLKSYAEELKKELETVEEHLKELEG